MRLVSSDGKKWFVEMMNNKEIPIGEFLKHHREKAGYKTVGALQTEAAIDHPLIHNLEKGQSQSLKTFILALEALDYEVVIRRSKDSGA